jgi:cytochrome c oxidase subunit I
MNHERPAGFISRYIFSTDHKTIGEQYFALSLAAVLIGMVLSWLMRMHVAYPDRAIPLLGVLAPTGAPGGIITPEFYLSLLTMHGTLMVFFVLTNAPFAAFGNYFLPTQIGAKNMAFPRLSALALWITVASFLVMLSQFFVRDLPSTSGWTAYPPLSALGGAAGAGLALGQNLWLISIALFCIGSVLGSLNFIVTVLDLRACGMSLRRMPTTVWAWFVTAVLALLSFAVLFPACVLLLLDRTAGTSFFVPAGLYIADGLQPHAGGTPLLWQHLFWFFGHPEVYIAILPSIGIVAHVLPVFARKPLFGARYVVGSIAATGFLSFLVWGHHMFVSGMSPFSATFFSLPTLIITIPATIITLMLLGTVYGSRTRFDTPALFCLGFISLFISGGISGFFLAQPSLDSYLHATYFVVAHFHLVMASASLFGVFAGVYFWYPKVLGRLMNETLGRLHFWLTFLGVYCIFMPMHYLGLVGTVRRYSAFVDPYSAALMPVHRFITIAALLTGAAQFIFLWNLIASRFSSRIASLNPWDATTLEWSAPSSDATISPSDERVADTGMWIGASAIAMCFAAVVSALIVRKGAGSEWMHFSLPRVLEVGSFALLLSLACSTRAMKASSASGAKAAIFATIVLGTVFLWFQGQACRELVAHGILLSTSASASFFFVLVVLHAIFTAGGIAALISFLVTLKSEQRPLVVASYWGVVGVLWITTWLILAWKI